MLMLKSTYHPNWHAYVDDVEAEAVMLMPGYIGVKLPPGDHLVRMEYKSRPLRGILLITGLLILPLIALVERGRERISRWWRRLIPGRIAVLKKSQRMNRDQVRPKVAT